MPIRLSIITLRGPAGAVGTIDLPTRIVALLSWGHGIMVTALGGQKARQSDPTRRPAREHRDRWLKTQIQRVLCAGEEPQEVGTQVEAQSEKSKDIKGVQVHLDQNVLACYISWSLPPRFWPLGWLLFRCRTAVLRKKSIQR